MGLEKINRVLCINDNDITLFILKRTLTKSNFAEQITEKGDGRQAINYCQQLIDSNEHHTGNYPQVIFLDLHMPVMDGWEFLDKFSTEIWPSFKETKIVITSQSIDIDDSIRAKEYPFVVDFLKNPITVDYLVQLHERLRSEVGGLKSVFA